VPKFSDRTCNRLYCLLLASAPVPFESQRRASASVPQLDHPFPPARGARRRGGMVELADFQAVVAVCLVVVRHVYPRCSRKKRTGESREKNADASVTEQRSRQQRRPSVHAVKHCSTSRTNTDVSVRSAEKCTLSVERSKEAFVRVRA
jgi:hypothetical protein